jgi:hypothetical protein
MYPLPISDFTEVDIHKLVPGDKYYAVSVDSSWRYARHPSVFRGTFTDYYYNDAGFKMIKFHHVVYSEHGMTAYVGSPEENPLGLWWRVWDEGLGPQSYRYYRASRFTDRQLKELKTRCTLRTRRQYERGLTGSTPSNMWFPRDLVRELSLKYLTDPAVGCVGQWR